MRVPTIAVALAAGAWLTAVDVLAQPAPTVQLPTFSFVGVSTTVLVPDSGAAFLGGINRASDGRNEFGVPGITLPGFQNRGIGQDRSASSFWATATIHDFDAMDQALLNAPSPSGIAGSNPNMSRGLPEFPAVITGQIVPRKAVNLAGNWQAEPGAPVPVSDVAVEQADRANRQTTRAEEADNFFARAKQDEADGKPNVAKIYYQMALRRATGERKQEVQARLDFITGRDRALANSSP